MIFKKDSVMKWLKISIVFLVSLLLLSSCQKKDSVGKVGTPKKLVVVTTLFPLYDFARTVGGDKVEVSLMLPPGVEAHSFEPKPQDAVRAATADLFVFTNEYMEPWAAKFVKGLNSGTVLLVDASRGVAFRTAGREKAAESGHSGHDAQEQQHHSTAMDPHIWLDFSNAQKVVENIAAAMIQKDPSNKDYYSEHAKSLKTELVKLDTAFKQGLSGCSQKVFLHGGHYTFGYLAQRYGLQYESASAVNADAEPSPATLISLIKQVKSLGLKYVFSEELLSPRVSEMIAREAGVSILMLHGAHNISKDDLAHGETFVSLMNKNLVNLRKGLECN